MFPKTSNRVQSSTSEKINQQIQHRTERNISLYGLLSHEEIEKRLQTLDGEWDIERVLETNASALAFLGILLGMRRKIFLIFPAMITGFLLQHALQGWCPPVPLLRRLGIRTSGEIDKERTALKALRGDFRKIPKGRSEKELHKILRAVER